MGEFYDSIRDELSTLDPQTTKPPQLALAAHSHVATFGAEFNANPTIVKQVQAAINARGYQPPLSVDGSFGPMTQAGIVWLQGQLGLAQDGVIGDQTLGALGIASPTGTSINTLIGLGKGTASAALAALEEEFAPLLDWAQGQPQPITQGKGVAPGFQATRASVVKSFVDWTTPLEGFLPFMYIDALGYVTTGMGNLIDPISTAMNLPWKNADGSRSSPAEIQTAWNAVDALRSDTKGQKQTSGPATQGGGSQGGYTSIRISKADVQNLVAQKLKENEGYILAHMPGYANAPADAQLAAHSMSWAMGPGFTGSWTQFHDAFNSGDYATAADQSHMQGVGIDMRNMANKLLLTNAAAAAATKKSPDTLFYLTGLASLYGPTSPLAAVQNFVAQNPKTVAGVVLALLAGGGAAIAMNRKA
jgi:peptidoglycan hydrolase-like protein with peptidoglycan-binding domain